MKWRVTVLCENSVGPLSGTLGEHGFSALIEPSGGAPVLFDTGQGLTLLHNAQRMNRNLALVEQVVLSHGHYDHSGGLKPLLDAHGPKRVFAHPGVFDPRFRVKESGEVIPIGIPCDREELERCGASLDLSSQFRKIAPGISLTGEVPRVTDFEQGDQGLYCDTGGQVRDSTRDDQSLVLESDRGLVLLLGCCHAGVVNTIERVTAECGRSDIYAIIGGTHLGFCNQEQVRKTISALRAQGIKKLVAGHCTGFATAALMSREFPAEFQLAQVGYSVEL